MDERQRLDLFVRRTEELLATRLVKSGGLRASFSLRAAVDEPVSIAMHSPDEDDLRSFLLTFRHFVADKEPVFVFRVANTLWQRLTGDEIRETLKSARANYSKALSHGSLKLVINAATSTPENVLDLWINGLYFHNDERKREALEQLDPMSAIFVRQVFLEVLVDATRYIQFLANAVVICRRDGLL